MTERELFSFLKDKKGLANNLLKNYSLEGITCNLLHRDKNQEIFRESDKSVSIFYLVSGEVMISKNDKVEVMTENDFFGVDTLESLKRNYNAIAIKQSIILELLTDKRHKKYDPAPIKNHSLNGHVIPRSNNSVQFEESSLNKDHNEDFSITHHNDIAIVFINLVKATLNESKILLDLLTNLINNGEKKIIIDLRMCTLVDSTFLGALVKSHKIIKKKEGNILLVYNTKDPSTLFMVTFMDKVFNTFENLDDAIKFFDKS